MGSLGGLTGTAGGAGGTGFARPELANITNPATQEQADQAYAGVQGSIGQQNALLNALQNQNGLNNQSQVYNQLQQVAAGQGPNPAQAMLSQATGQNVANQAALMAGQRGASANVGLMAQLAAQQGANTQQQAAGQAATMQANQSLGAIGQAGQMANQQAANQIGQTNANTTAQQAEQGNLLNAIGNYNTNQTSSQNSVNAANAGLAQTTMQGQQAMIGGAANALGAGTGLIKGATSLMADGGVVSSPQSMIGNKLKTTMMAAEGGVVPAMVSPGERFLPPDDAQKVAEGKENPLKAGEKIPGKPEYPGNDYRNDVVSKNLDVGGVVIPNAVLQSKNPGPEAMRFVEAVMQKRKMRN